MKQRIPLSAPTTLALALLLASSVQAAGEPRVMFVSKGDNQPVLIDLQGKQIPAQKGAVIPPGFTVMVPEGATVQIMTAEKGILAVRPNSLLRVDGGGGADPYKLTLDRGGVRVANPEINFRKFEINTPNAQVNFDKGDHETMFLMPGKLKDGSWGTFARGSNDETLVKTQGGDLKLMPREIGHVPGGDNSKPTIITLNEGGKQPQNPVSYTPGAREIATTQMTDNFQSMSDPATGGSDPAARGGDPGTRSLAPKARDPIPGLATYKPSPNLKLPVAVNSTPIGKPLSRIDPALANLNRPIDPSKNKKETMTGVTDRGTFLFLDKTVLTAGSTDPNTQPRQIDVGGVTRGSGAASSSASSSGSPSRFSTGTLNSRSNLKEAIPAETLEKVCRTPGKC